MGSRRAPTPIPPWLMLVHFAIEVLGWLGLGRWGWNLGHGGSVGALLTIAMPIAAECVITLVRVPNDPPGMFRYAFAVPGWVRLGIEVLFYSLAAYSLWRYWHPLLFLATLIVVAIVIYVRRERLKWLIRQ